MPRCAWCGRKWQEVMDTSFRPQTPRSGKSQQNRAHTPPGQGQQPPGQGRQQTLRRRSRKGKKNQGQQNAPPGAAVPLEPAAYPSIPAGQLADVFDSWSLCCSSCTRAFGVCAACGGAPSAPSSSMCAQYASRADVATADAANAGFD